MMEENVDGQRTGEWWIELKAQPVWGWVKNKNNKTQQVGYKKHTVRDRKKKKPAQERCVVVYGDEQTSIQGK